MLCIKLLVFNAGFVKINFLFIGLLDYMLLRFRTKSVHYTILYEIWNIFLDFYRCIYIITFNTDNTDHIFICIDMVLHTIKILKESI